MRIISGKFRGLKLQSPLDSNTRPTSDRLKEALFSTLESHKYNLNINTSKVLDICSGTGALGIEAISRGAKVAYFIEKDPKAIDVIEKNILKLKINNKNEVHIKLLKDDAIKALGKIRTIFDIVFIDPPYNSSIIEKCLIGLKELNLINNDSYIFAESSKNENFNSDEYEVFDTKIYGKSKLTILRLLGSGSIE
ncbi:16S rRNA (guanine(966)-N(2))-methyltransferase RsmD [Alphaproteobacteria bacterium]|jgi:16S rRNA (guanine966-N2)-methyltransferase|nr:16S rRNA (guanine(966)-N(2))-methyltransferase RsmD [Alphaproteobacteria bacterium]